MKPGAVELFEQQLIDKQLDLVGRIMAIRNMTKELHWLLQDQSLDDKRLDYTLLRIMETCGDPRE